MTDTDWLAVATAVAAILGFIGALLSLRRQRKEISEIHSKVGNGFAEEVTEALGNIASGVDALRIQVGIANSRINSHVKWHASGVTAQRKPK